MNGTTVFVGQGVHKDSITAACANVRHEAPSLIWAPWAFSDMLSIGC